MLFQNDLVSFCKILSAQADLLGYIGGLRVSTEHYCINKYWRKLKPIVLLGIGCFFIITNNFMKPLRVSICKRHIKELYTSNVYVHLSC